MTNLTAYYSRLNINAQFLGMEFALGTAKDHFSKVGNISFEEYIEFLQAEYDDVAAALIAAPGVQQ